MLRKGRLGDEVDKDFSLYTSSLDFDRHIFSYDLLGSMAHARMLARQGIISGEDSKIILQGLKEIYREGYSSLEVVAEQEDIHMAVEEKLKEKIGQPASKLHTARSRNDQVALDLRMFAREEVIKVARKLVGVERVLLRLASEHSETLMPGYTHLQAAQPVTLGHHLLAYFNFFLRDLERLRDSLPRISASPLGACALATTSFPIDREATARDLGFAKSFSNSQDAVASRDFLLEPLSALAMCGVNLTRLCEEVILWSTSEFGFIDLPEQFSSTSSVMPQKKNPDALEIMRARASRVIGNLSSALAINKSLPLAYNRDLQELSPIAYHSFRSIGDSLSLLSDILASLHFNKQAMLENVTQSLSTATELADHLVRYYELGFREAHQIVGQVVLESRGEITLQALKEVASKVAGREIALEEGELKKVLDPERAVRSRQVEGSPSPGEVEKAVESGERDLESLEDYFLGEEERIQEAFSNLLGD